MTIIVSFGLPGTGKSYFAKHLAEKINAYHIKSDEVRAEMKKMGTYDPHSKLAVYDEMMNRIKPALKEYGQVIVDATFHSKKTRKLIEQKAKELKETLYFIRLVADEKVIKERVSKNRPDSEADFKVYKLLKEEMDPVQEEHLTLDSGRQDIGEMLEKAINYLGLKENHHE